MNRKALLHLAVLLAVCSTVAVVWTAAAPPAASQIATEAEDGFANPFLGLAPPPNAVVLFDGTNTDAWDQGDGATPLGWAVEDGAMTVVAGSSDAYTKATFRDAYIHLEFRCPDMPDAQGQGKGNSGVFLRDRLDREIQVLDSWGKETVGTGDCGAIYGQYATLVNACRPPMEWQTYDIIYRSARFDENGELLEPDRATVFQNGIVTHNNVVLSGPYDDQPGRLHLQDHWCPVSYRNIWWVELPLQGAGIYE